MGHEEADALQALIEKTNALPLWGMTNSHRAESQRLEGIRLYRALRESDREVLRKLHPDWDQDRRYRVDSLPDRISDAFSDLLYGSPPDIRAAAEENQKLLDEILKHNQMGSELKRWAAEVSAEGEQWWRVFVNLELSPVPILELHSRLDVFPYWVGRTVRAVAFLSELYSKQNEDARTGTVTVEVWRHVEIQTDGLVRNLLYKGTKTTLGEQRDLADTAETEGLDEEWDHGLKIMLAGRIPNKLGSDYRYGISHYHGILDQLLDLNEARTIMAENARLAAKKRMVVPTSELDENGNWKGAGDDIIPTESLNGELDEKSGSAKDFAILEYTFDAKPLREHMDELEETALTRVGLNVQFVNGDTGEGSAVSGVALRTKLIPTTLAAEGLGKHWDNELPVILSAMQQVDALPDERGGCGHDSWREPEEPPTVTRGTVLPEDPADKAERHSGLVQSELESLKTAISDLHPEWTEEQVEEEIQRIREDRMPFGEGSGEEGAPAEGEAPPAADVGSDPTDIDALIEQARSLSQGNPNTSSPSGS